MTVQGTGSPQSAGMSDKSRLTRFFPHSRIASNSDRSISLVNCCAPRCMKERCVRFLICSRRVKEEGQRLTSKRVIRSRNAERAGANNIGSNAPTVSLTSKHLPCHSRNSGWDWRKATKEGVVGANPKPAHARIFGLMQDSISFVFGSPHGKEWKLRRRRFGSTRNRDSMESSSRTVLATSQCHV